ncbi:MAG: hypothetical protein IKR48_07090, partial [Kiritimatiellae bacterium]|nr:hypothetical protein [Kiritimatiellia bacterium]
YAQEDFGNNQNNLKTTFERGARTNRSAHRLSFACNLPLWRAVCYAGELARALRTSCFFRLFLLFSKDDGEIRRCAQNDFFEKSPLDKWAEMVFTKSCLMNTERSFFYFSFAMCLPDAWFWSAR